MMTTREDMKGWIIEALRSMKGKGWPKDISKYIWEHYEPELKASGSLLYTWQYDIRWAAQSLRISGKLKPVDGKRNLPWELA
ncbi:MAG: hypothetical protein KGI54_08190 [Pseudomonadota bacterium]|nr:hypothetical protein [Pseudomonadota bacterium]